MSVRFPSRLFSACVMLWCCVTASQAQDTKPAPAEGHGELPIIVDEPRTVDPATFVPTQLADVATADFSDSSLREVIHWLRDQQNLVVLLENQALSGIGLSPGDPVSDRLDETPIYLLLNRLRSLNLGWYYEDDVLHVTSAESAAERLSTVPYRIGDLFDAGYEEDSEALQEAIISQTDPVWDEVGGDATLRFARPGAMVLHGTEKTHNAVLDLLETYRTAFRSSKPRARDKEDPNEIVTVYYRMHTNMAQDLSMLLPHWVRPGSWISEAHPEAPGQVMRVASAPELSKLDAELSGAPETKQMARLLVTERAVLIIRQTRAAQEEIEEVIRRVESGDTRPSDGMMGGMGGMGGAGFGGGFFNVQ